MPFHGPGLVLKPLFEDAGNVACSTLGWEWFRTHPCCGLRVGRAGNIKLPAWVPVGQNWQAESCPLGCGVQSLLKKPAPGAPERPAEG